MKIMMMMMVMTEVHLTHRVITFLYKVVASIDGRGVARWVVRVLIIMMVVRSMVMTMIMMMIDDFEDGNISQLKCAWMYETFFFTLL